MATNGSNNTFPYLTSIDSQVSDELNGWGRCKPGLFLPVWPHYHDPWTMAFHGIVYFLALCYTFVGVSIVADRFMAAIEMITSQERDVIVTSKTTGVKQIVSVRIWNDTVSNLTLMALGSSAPEILLSIIEIIGNNFESGELGPSTIVGSAAFNMFVIIAICVWCVPSTTVKKIKHLRVFIITMALSVFAYIWLLFILVWSSPGVITVMESLITFLFFPFTVLLAYIADKRLLIYRFLDKRYRMSRRMKGIVETTEGTGIIANGGDIELTPKKQNGVVTDGHIRYIDASEEDIMELEDQRDECIEILKDLKSKHPNASVEELAMMAHDEVTRIKPKSHAFYRVQIGRKLMGAGNAIKEQLKKSLKDESSEEDDDDKNKSNDNVMRVYFDPTHYTVMEDCGKFSVTVTRSGDLDMSLMIDYATEDGTAKDKTDYRQSKGTLSFGPGESHKQISIEVINDDVFEEDEHFYVSLSNPRLLTASAALKNPEIEITEPSAKVTILDDDHSGVFSFIDDVVQVPESIGEYRLKVNRFCGARGRVSVPYKTIPLTARDGEDFMMAYGRIVFENNVTSQDIVLKILNNEAYEKSTTFQVELSEPKRDDLTVNQQLDQMKGAPRLGELTLCLIRIQESKEFKETVDKLIKRARTVSALSTSSWEEQFLQALTVPTLSAVPEDEEDEEVDQQVMVHVEKKKSILSYALHYMTLFWKILFALIPPPNYYNGWLCFTVSIIMIGLLTALIGDLASHFGCTVNLIDSVTAISIVALGTSVPDTFASKIAAQNDKYADSSIGNVTGSNAVNVFLGIGIAWSIASIYHAFKGDVFTVAPGSLGFSVTLFCIMAFVCAAVLMLRRSPKIVGGELGGPNILKIPTALLFVSLWIIYVIISSLEAYGIIKGF